MRNGICGLLQGFIGVWYIRGCRDGLVQGGIISVCAQFYDWLENVLAVIYVQ